ncbi:MAG: helix-turn-helix transcriptional regulator, partial [Bacteroidales bacterium]|nr:helix-turn-helix transcriptional regulator [Bacteroidales bacterium]
LLTRQILLKDYFNSSLSSLTIRNGKVMHEEDKEILERVNDFIKEHISDENLSAEMIEQFLGQSKASFYRKFKDLLDKTPSEYIKNVRLEYAAKLLRTTKMTVSEIIYKSGFSNKSYFYREFKGVYGCSPNDFRKI